MRSLNCKRARRMMPFYVGGDLPIDGYRAIARHLAACEMCGQLAEEFHESQNLLTEGSATPAFEREFYDGIRHMVLAEIAHQHSRSKFFFGRRWIYAMTIAILFAGFAFLLGKRHEPRQKSVLVSANTNSESESDRYGISAPIAVPPKFPQLRLPKESTRHGTLWPAPRKRTQLTGKSDAIAVASLASDSASRAEVTRIEIQTGNPNIRIIWLVHEDDRAAQSDPQGKDEPRNRE